MNSTKLKDLFDQIEYYLIRLLLLALLLISAYKLLEREIHGTDAKERPASGITRLQYACHRNSISALSVSSLENTRVAQGKGEKTVREEKSKRSARRPV